MFKIWIDFCKEWFQHILDCMKRSCIMLDGSFSLFKVKEWDKYTLHTIKLIDVQMQMEMQRVQM